MTQFHLIAIVLFPPSSIGRQSTMSARSVPMPELPGMWYDASRNRYFRITADHPPSRPPLPLPRIRATDVPSPRSLLRHRELGSVSKSMLSASLLAQARQRHLPEGRISGINVPFHADAGCAAIFSPPGTVDLRSFPSGACIDSIYVPEGALTTAWSAEKQLLVIALRGTPGHDRLRFCDFPIRRNSRKIQETEAIPGQISTVALSPKCQVAMTVSCSNQYSNVYTVTIGAGDDGAFQIGKMRHSDQSQGLASIFPTEQCVITGTRAGNVYRWDLRDCSKAASTLKPSRKRRSVVCLKGSLDNERCYVSSLRNGEDNLVGWDWRYTGKGPVVQFSGHRNVCKKLEFDVNFGASGGLLMSGGDDCVVRMWDINRGGAPLAQVKFDEIPHRVALVGWAQKARTERLTTGAWVMTRRTAYTLEVGSGL